MRQILFRGKRVDNGEWVYGFYVEDESKKYIFTFDQIKRGIDLGGYLDCCQMYEVKPETVGQYTNLKDKHNAGIFEGDIVEIPYEGWKLVKWFDCSCGFEPFVLGNIHDNPELMNRVSRYYDE